MRARDENAGTKISKSLAYFMAALGTLALLAVPAFAHTITVTVNGQVDPTVPKGLAVLIGNVFTEAPGETDTLTWEAVVTPSGETFVITFVPTITFSGGTGGLTVECDVPFGGAPGSLGGACSEGVAVWHDTASSWTPGSLQLQCAPTGAPPAFSSPDVTSPGDTNQEGTYYVLACDGSSVMGGEFTSADQKFNVPEFGSLAVAVAFGFGGMAYLRGRRAFSAPSPA
jgi:hypothetical protein